MKTILYTTLLATAIGLAAGCGSKKTESTPSSSEPVPAVFTTTRPEGSPVAIPDARTSAKPGEGLLLAGKVMGVSDPFVEGRGVFIVGDEATLTSCDLMGEDDHCPTPWDACCDSPEARIAGTATIQVLDEEGSILARGVQGVGGLDTLTRVIVSGTVAANATPEALIVNAQAIYVVP